jgi:hypothetical protein
LVISLKVHPVVLATYYIPSYDSSMLTLHPPFPITQSQSSHSVGSIPFQASRCVLFMNRILVKLLEADL